MGPHADRRLRRHRRPARARAAPALRLWAPRTGSAGRRAARRARAVTHARRGGRRPAAVRRPRPPRPAAGHRYHDLRDRRCAVVPRAGPRLTGAATDARPRPALGLRGLSRRVLLGGLAAVRGVEEDLPDAGDLLAQLAVDLAGGLLDLVGAQAVGG